MRNTSSRSAFARQVWQRFGAPEPPTFFSFGNKTRNTLHTRLRVGMTTLKAHLFNIQHPNTPSPVCACGYHDENTTHFILWCPLYHTQRVKLINAVRIITPNFDNFSAKLKLDTLLFAKDLNKHQGTQITHHLQTFIVETNRFTNTT